MIAMILAAGRGERLRPLTDEIPKALVEVQGRSLLEWHLRRIRDAGIQDVVINLGWLGEQIAERIGSGSKHRLNVVYSPEGDNALETGGGIHHALPMLGGEPFLVINVDSFTEMPVPEVSLADKDVGHLVLVPTPDYFENSDFDLVDGKVRAVDSPSLTFAGCAVYRPEFFDNCEAGRFSLAPMLFAAAGAGQLQGSIYDGPWADIGTPERLAISCQNKIPPSTGRKGAV